MNDTRSLRTSILGLLLLWPSLQAAAVPVDLDLHHRILNTTESFEPTVSRNVVMFSYAAPRGVQMVSLALEHERYRRFHTYERNPHGIFILTLPIPEGMRSLRYRVIVDGLWTVDPLSEVRMDDRGIRVSAVDIPATSAAPKPGAILLPDGRTRFVYLGAPEARVSLIGDFNRWDPFLTPMPESPIHPGLYSTTINLPAESMVYRFVVDGREIADPENPAVSRNGWGETASMLPR